VTHTEALSEEILDERRELADALTIDPGTDIFEDGGRRDLARSMIGDRSVPSSFFQLAKKHK